MWSSRPPGMPLPLAEVSEFTMSPSSKWSSLSPREVAPAGSSLTLTPDPSGRFPEPRRVRRERTNLSRAGATTRTDPPGRRPPGGVRDRVRSAVQAVVLPGVTDVGGVALGCVGRLLRRVLEGAVAPCLVEGPVARLGDGAAAVEVAAPGVVPRALRRGALLAVLHVLAGDVRAIGAGAVEVGVRHAGARLLRVAHLWLLVEVRAAGRRPSVTYPRLAPDNPAPWLG